MISASALGGNLGASTASFFLLDPVSYSVPIEPLIDLIPGITPMRVTYDIVEQEQAIYEYDVTEHAIQGFLDITSNVHKRLEQITLVGFLGASPPLLGGPPVPPSPGAFLRLDLLRVRNLKAMADREAPVMVVTPRCSLARAFIKSIHHSWNPAMGNSSMVAVTVSEARLVSPLLATAVASDFPAQAPGNNKAAGGGQSAAKPTNTSATPSETPGVAPSIGGPPAGGIPLAA